MFKLAAIHSNVIVVSWRNRKAIWSCELPSAGPHPWPLSQSDWGEGNSGISGAGCDLTPTLSSRGEGVRSGSDLGSEIGGVRSRPSCHLSWPRFRHWNSLARISIADQIGRAWHHAHGRKID